MLRKPVPFTPAVTRSRCSELRSIRRSLHSSPVSTSIDLHHDEKSRLREPCVSPETRSRAGKRVSIAVQCRSCGHRVQVVAPQFHRDVSNSRLARKCVIGEALVAGVPTRRRSCQAAVAVPGGRAAFLISNLHGVAPLARALFEAPQAARRLAQAAWRRSAV